MTQKIAKDIKTIDDRLNCNEGQNGNKISYIAKRKTQKQRIILYSKFLTIKGANKTSLNRAA